MAVRKRKRAFARRHLLLALVSALAASACRGGREEPAPSTPATSVAERARVLNGDVIIVDGQNLRLANAYAPQPPPDARCWAEALAARQVTRELRALVADARDLQVRTASGRDEYNRRFAFVTLDGLDLGETLYDLGLAARRTDGRFNWCASFTEETRGAPAMRSLLDFSR